MVVGKTSSSISKAEVFSKFSETQVLHAVFPYIAELPCVISSPLRVDNHPSFSIYVDCSGHIRYKDFAYPSVHGGLVDLLCEYWGCSFPQALDRISCLDIDAPGCVALKSPNVKLHACQSSASSSTLQVKIRPWQKYDYDYWASYGISPEWLHYAEIYPVSHKIVTKTSSNNSSRYVFPCDKYAYCYVERKEGNTSLKVYQPYNTKGFKWSSKMDVSVIGLWTKIPEYGDKVIICSSLKDALVVSCQLHIPTLCLQGEGYSMSATAISELKRRYKKVFISFDTDAAGIADSKRLALHTGFTNVIPDLGAEKDFSDYYKSLKDKSQFTQLKALFN